jgi:EAL domain-containing protein (putative c-di-GMP-specific phosphodiesterase class I)
MQNPESAVKTMTELREMGVKISIDDFGTGYSSLGYLKRLPIDILKLDRSFVNGATTDPDDAALVMAIISLAHNLKLRVIAEGVETEEHVRFLRLLKCDGGQGYLFGKPMPADLFRALIGAGDASDQKERALLSA